MSIQAMNWVLEQAPITEEHRHLFPVLMALANAADEDGTGAFPSKASISWQTRKSERAVTNDLRTLEKKAIIRRGNQARAHYLSADRRPVVYDLAMERSRDMSQRPVKRQPSGTSATETGMKPASPREATGVKWATDRGEVGGTTGVKRASPNPSGEPSNNPSPPAPSAPDREESSASPVARPEGREGDASQKKAGDGAGLVRHRLAAVTLVGELPRASSIEEKGKLVDRIVDRIADGVALDVIAAALKRQLPDRIKKSLTGLYLRRLDELDTTRPSAIPTQTTRLDLHTYVDDPTDPFDDCVTCGLPQSHLRHRVPVGA